MRANAACFCVFYGCFMQGRALHTVVGVAIIVRSLSCRMAKVVREL